MKEIQVIPLQSANLVKLGWTRKEVQTHIGQPGQTNGNADYYQETIPFFSVHYDTGDQVEYLEISNPVSD